MMVILSMVLHLPTPMSTVLQIGSLRMTRPLIVIQALPNPCLSMTLTLTLLMGREPST